MAAITILSDFGAQKNKVSHKPVVNVGEHWKRLEDRSQERKKPVAAGFQEDTYLCRWVGGAPPGEVMGGRRC